MEQERAFRKALLTGSLIGLGFWGVLVLVLRPDAEMAWVIGILAAFTLFISVLLVYLSYRQEGQLKREFNPRVARISGALFVVASFANGVDTLQNLHSYNNRRLLLKITVSVCWLLAGVLHFRRASRIAKYKPLPNP